MQAVLCVCWLAALAAGQQLDDNYLPPTGPDRNQGNRQCPPQRVITQYTTNYVTSTQVQVVSNPVVQVVTQTAVSTQVVPSEVVRTSVFQSTVVVPRDVVRTSQEIRYVTQRRTVPGAVRQVVRTSDQLVVRTQLQQRVATVETTQFSTAVRFQTDFRTRVNTRTVNVPQVRVVTQRQQVPGPVVVVTQTQERVNTRVVTRQPPPVVSTVVVPDVRVSTVRVPVPGAVRTSVRVVQSSQVVPVQSEVQVPQVRTVQAVSTRLFERTLFQTFTSQQVVPVEVVRTNFVDSRVVRTQQIQVTSTRVQVNTRFVTVREPSQPIVNVVYNTDVRFVTQPGQVIPVVRTQYVDQVVNREVIETRVVPQVVEKVVYVDKPCVNRGGYGGGGRGGYGGGGRGGYGGGGRGGGYGRGGGGHRGYGYRG